MMGGMNYHAELERTLQGLGFTPADFNRPTKEFRVVGVCVLN